MTGNIVKDVRNGRTPDGEADCEALAFGPGRTREEEPEADLDARGPKEDRCVQE